MLLISVIHFAHSKIVRNHNEIQAKFTSTDFHIFMVILVCIFSFFIIIVVSLIEACLPLSWNTKWQNLELILKKSFFGIIYAFLNDNIGIKPYFFYIMHFG